MSLEHAPLILVTADIDPEGSEQDDFSQSLAVCYERAILHAGGIPWIVSASNSPLLLKEMVRRAQGLLLTGGGDLAPDIYEPEMPAKLRSLVSVSPDNGQRDHRELLLIREALDQNKPILGICRGHQVLNVAFGGTLLPDIPSCVDSPINHKRMDARYDAVHQVELTQESLLYKITGKRSLGVNSTHHQAVGKLAPGLKVSASSADGIVEAFELAEAQPGRDPFFLSVQFHPERMEDRFPEHAAIFRAFVGACVAKAE